MGLHTLSEVNFESGQRWSTKTSGSRLVPTCEQLELLLQLSLLPCWLALPDVLKALGLKEALPLQNAQETHSART